LFNAIENYIGAQKNKRLDKINFTIYWKVAKIAPLESPDLKI